MSSTVIQWWSSLGCLAKVQPIACRTRGDKMERGSQAEKLSCSRDEPSTGTDRPYHSNFPQCCCHWALWAQAANLAQERAWAQRGLQGKGKIQRQKEEASHFVTEQIVREKKKNRRINLHTTDLMLQYMKIFVACVGFWGLFFVVFLFVCLFGDFFVWVCLGFLVFWGFFQFVACL